jgi:UDP-2,4-diacetamido-2,4,6-trideoxy-beta-L-altropyranose hydrolase
MAQTPPRHVVFRADAGQRIGTGHVMRFLSIADRLAQDGVLARFMCKAHDGHMAAQIAARGYACDLLPVVAGWTAPDYLGWLGGSAAQDAALTGAAIRAAGGADLLVVDHYALDAAYHRALRADVSRIAVLDDLHNRPHDCDVLIDQNIGHSAAAYAGLVPVGARLLVGAEYAPINIAFSALRAASLARRAGVTTPKVLLISLGGADPDNVTLAALDAVQGLGFDHVHVVLSGIARHLNAVRKACATLPSVTLHIDTPHMPQLMAGADLSIGAAGVTALERCVLGLPTLMVVVADNQIEAAQRMANLGAVSLLGNTASITAQTIRTALVASLNDQSGRLQSMSVAAAALCDGQGLDRIAPALLQLISPDNRP